MTWGVFFMYYECPECGWRFKYDIQLISKKGDDFGKCPNCNAVGRFIKDGAIDTDDSDYEEVD